MKGGVSMNAWHKKYLAGAFSGIPARELYAQRLGTLQDALDLIEDGDCLTWSTHGSEPKAFLSQLHTIALRLTQGVDCWNTISRYDYPVTRDASLAGKFRHHTFFFDKWSVAAQGREFYAYFPSTSTITARNCGAVCRPTSSSPKSPPWTSMGMCT